MSDTPKCPTVRDVSSIATGSCSLEAWLEYAVQPMTVEILDTSLNPSNQQASLNILAFFRESMCPG